LKRKRWDKPEESLPLRKGKTDISYDIWIQKLLKIPHRGGMGYKGKIERKGPE